MKNARAMGFLAVWLAALTAIIGGVIWKLAPGPVYGFGGSGIPAEKSDYIGNWQGEDHVLRIAASGKVHYERHSGGADVRLDLPVQAFLGDDFVIGVLFWTTTFKVTAPPHREPEGWRMTADGVVYRRP